MKTKLLLAIFAATSLISVASCSNNIAIRKNTNLFINDDIWNKNFRIDTIYNKDQIATIINNTPFFENRKRQAVQFEKVFVNKNKLYGQTRNAILRIRNFKDMNKYVVNVSEKTKKIIVNNSISSKNEIKDINYFYSEMPKEDSFDINKINNLKKQYVSFDNIENNNNIPFYPDLNIILNNIKKDNQDQMNLNWFPNFINLKHIRAKSYESVEEKSSEQIKYWETLIKLNLQAFNLGSKEKIGSVLLKNINANKSGDSISFNIFVYNTDGKLLTSEESQKQLFYINGFKRAIKIRESTSFENYNFRNNDKNILFNEYLNEPEFFFDKNNLFTSSQITFDSFVLNLNEYFLSTARSFLFYLKTNYGKNIFLNVPEHKRDEDLKYEVMNYEMSDVFLNSSDVFKINIKVTKKDGTTKIYPWYSLDFNVHNHTFRGYITSKKYDLSEISPRKLYNIRNNEYFDLKTNKSKVTEKKPFVIEANYFYENMLLDLLHLSDLRFSNINLRNFNKKKKDIEPILNKFIPSLIEDLELSTGLDIFKYLISYKEKDLNSGAFSFKLELIDWDQKKPGVLLLKADLLDTNGKSLLSEKNQNRIIEYGGFKGFDFTEYIKHNKKIKTNEKLKNFDSMKYFIKNRANLLKNIFKFKEDS